MAMHKHPVTGVPLNRLGLRRKSLDEAEKETVRLLRHAGHKMQDIAAMLGTNQGRVAEAIEESGNSAEDPPDEDQPLLI